MASLFGGLEERGFSWRKPALHLYDCMPVSGPAQANPTTKYLFIDGGYLRGELEAIGLRVFKKPLLIDHSQLGYSYLRAFYYDCSPGKRHAETDADWESRKRDYEAEIARLQLLDGFHVYEGAVRGVGKKVKQKAVDVLLAVQMLSHTIRGNMNRATLLAGDLDFLPVIDELVNLGMYITVWSNPRTTAMELMQHADQHNLLTLREFLGMVPRSFWNANLPRPIVDVGPKRSLFDDVGKSKRSGDGAEVIITQGRAAGFTEPLCFEVSSPRPDPNNCWWMVRHPNMEVAIAAGREVFGDFPWPH